MAQKAIISVSVGDKRFSLFRKKLVDLSSPFGETILGLSDGQDIESDSIMLDEDEKGRYIVIDADPSDFQHFMDFMRSRQTALGVKTEEELRRMLVFSTTWKIKIMEQEVREQLSHIGGDSAGAVVRNSTRESVVKITSIEHAVVQDVRSAGQPIARNGEAVVSKHIIGKNQQVSSRTKDASVAEKNSHKSKAPDSNQLVKDKRGNGKTLPASDNRIAGPSSAGKAGGAKTNAKVVKHDDNSTSGDDDADDSDAAVFRKPSSKSAPSNAASKPPVKSAAPPASSSRKNEQQQGMPEKRRVFSDDDDDDGDGEDENISRQPAVNNKKRKQSITDDDREREVKQQTMSENSRNAKKTPGIVAANGGGSKTFSAATNESQKRLLSLTKDVATKSKKNEDLASAASTTAAEEKSKKLSRFAKQPIEIFALTKPTVKQPSSAAGAAVPSKPLKSPAANQQQLSAATNRWLKPLSEASQQQQQSTATVQEKPHKSPVKVVPAPAAHAAGRKKSISSDDEDDADDSSPPVAEKRVPVVVKPKGKQDAARDGSREEKGSANGKKVHAHRNLQKSNPNDSDDIDDSMHADSCDEDQQQQDAPNHHHHFVTTGEPRFLPLHLNVPNFFSFDQLQNTRDHLRGRGSAISGVRVTMTDQVRDFVCERLQELEKKKSVGY